MKHVLFAGMSAKGHLYPALAIVSELVRRGYRVTYVSGEDLADAIEGAGARPIGFATDLPEVNHTEVANAKNAATAPLLFFEEAERIVRAVDAHLGDDVPDLIVCDHSVAHAGRALSYRWDRPLAVFCPGFANNGDPELVSRLLRPVGGSLDTTHPAMLEYISRAGRMMRENRMSGVSIEDFLIGNDRLTFAFYPREFQYFAERFDDTFQFLGPCLSDRSFMGGWMPPSDGRPIALVSRGTIMNDSMREEAIAYFATCARAFEGLGWHVVMSIGNQLNATDLGPLPEGVEVRNWVSHQEVLPHARIYVNHAGISSLMEALYYQTPLLCMPASADAVINAERVEELGLGTMIHADEMTAEGVRTAVLAIDGDEETQKRVRAMGEQCVRAGGAVRAADVLEAYLADASPSRSWRHRSAAPASRG
ncbi:macrolide family glycosyltransferase [Jidongwangia harbinensis]|uniref:macrolide family glycosyltransferase n=1 Tax=Jidongwangia harbinensis TaxID=2878561 RepID=UPI001CD9AE76|nr:macrolide family glycosyltransferase [Jidongwangia harbinensis]MCA2217203.1 hypothetical protein [Jidongwangia harbinensis]